MKKIFIFVVILGFFTPIANADLGSEMSGFWNRATGGISNVNAPTFYKSQAGGNIMSLGSIYARTQSKNVNLANLQLPSARAGCGGIDLFAGSFSFVNADQLIALGRAIASNATGFAFKLALATITPMIEENMSELMSWIQKMNETNLNSCELAKNAVSMAWSEQNASVNDTICRDIATSKGIFSDYVRSRRGCGNEAKRDDINKTAPDSAQTSEINYTWASLKKSQVFAGDDKFNEAMLSLVGTDIIRITDSSTGEKTLISLPAMIFDENSIKALVEGGNLKGYICDEYEKCLMPKEGEITIDTTTSFLKKVEGNLQDIYDNTVTDSVVPNEAIALINTTTLPIYSMIKTMVYAKIPISQMGSLNEIVAYDLIFRFLEENLREIEKARTYITNQKGKSPSDANSGDRLTTVRRSQELVSKKRYEQIAKFNDLLKILESYRAIQTQIASGMKKRF